MQYLTWYNTDETVESKGSALIEGKSTDFVTKGEWKVEGGKLVNRVTSSTFPGIAGQVLSNTFVAACKQTVVFMSSENALVVNEREDPEHPDEDFHDRLVIRTYQVMVDLQGSTLEDYAKWLSPDVAVTRMPSSLFPRETSQGLNEVFANIETRAKRYTRDSSVQRLTRQGDRYVLEMSNVLTPGTGWPQAAAGAAVSAPSVSIFELSGHQITSQNDYLALNPVPSATKS